MKNQKWMTIQRICLWSGIGLLAAAGILLFAWQQGIHISEQRAEDYVHTLRTLIPEPQGAVPEPRTDNTMPVFPIEGTDFIGILEMPLHGSELPVCAEWGKSFRYPCCFSGSVYDRSIQIGGTSQKGQYDFYREISVGDEVFFTDMTGNRYAYTVKNIRYRKRADQAALKSEEAALTLFIKNVNAFEYILIFCDVSG